MYKRVGAQEPDSFPVKSSEEAQDWDNKIEKNWEQPRALGSSVLLR